MGESITRAQLRKLAGEAYAFGCAQGPDGYDRGYASGVEDLARLLSDRDPAISERLVEIMRASGLRGKLPALYR
jgi:hypothetical protein